MKKYIIRNNNGNDNCDKIILLINHKIYTYAWLWYQKVIGNDDTDRDRNLIDISIDIHNKHYQMRLITHDYVIKWTFSTLLALCEGNIPVTGEFPSHRPVTRSSDLHLIKRFSKKSRRGWFEAPSRSGYGNHSWWRHGMKSRSNLGALFGFPA